MGDTNRAISETPMNLASSRSHCIFTLHIEARQVRLLWLLVAIAILVHTLSPMQRSMTLLMAPGLCKQLQPLVAPPRCPRDQRCRAFCASSGPPPMLAHTLLAGCHPWLQTLKSAEATADT